MPFRQNSRRCPGKGLLSLNDVFLIFLVYNVLSLVIHLTKYVIVYSACRDSETQEKSTTRITTKMSGRLAAAAATLFTVIAMTTAGYELLRYWT